MFRYPVFPHLQGELTNNANRSVFDADFEFCVFDLLYPKCYGV